MKRFSLRYSLLTYRLDQLWFPLAFWALFVVMALLMRGEGFVRSPAPTWAAPSRSSAASWLPTACWTTRPWSCALPPRSALPKRCWNAWA